MSLGARATAKGGAKTSSGHQNAQNKHNHVDKTKNTEKTQTKPQATTEQMRMAHMIDRKNEDTSDMRKMVLDLMDMTRRPEEEVCSALHDCDNDMARACNLLFEDSERIQGQWQTNEKKKKKGSSGTGGASGDGAEANADARPAQRNRSGPRQRREPRGASEGGGTAGGEGEFEHPRGARGTRGGRGGARGGRGGGRGGARGGRGGARSNGAPSASYHRDRGNRAGGGGGGHIDSAPIEDWDAMSPDNNGPTGVFPTADDWDNEEWSGSLADTKVFTPSTAQEAAAAGEPENVLPTAAQHNCLQQDEWSSPVAEAPPVSYSGSTGVSNAQQAAGQPVNDAQQSYAVYQQQQQQAKVGGKLDQSAAQQLTQAIEMHQQLNQHPINQQPSFPSRSLSEAQSQYLSQLTQQSQQQEQPKDAYSSHSVYTSNYGTYGNTDMSSQRKTQQRARVPPPSKIPSSAVEMPGDVGSGSISFLDVQFGAMDVQFDASYQNDVPNSSGNALDKFNSSMSQQSDTTTASVTSSSLEAAADRLATDPATSPYATNNMLSESLSSVEATVTSQATTVPPARSPSHQPSTVLETQLSASMKQQLSVEAGTTPTAAATTAAAAAGYPHHVYAAAAPAPAAAYQQPTAATGVASKHQSHQQQSVYAATQQPHHAVSHHAVYGANVYAQQQVNSSGQSLTGSGLTSAYPPSGALSQYHAQPINSYQTSTSASVYGGSALYTAAPYNAYQATATKIGSKDASQYDNAVVSNNSLSSSATSTQSSSVKATTSSVKSTSAISTSSSLAHTPYVQAAAPQPTFYAQQQTQAAPPPPAPQTVAAAAYAAYAAEEAQMMRGTMPHHMAGYYEVGYGREAGTAFGLGERFGRGDAASPQQVLPPGYAYFYGGLPPAPPPSTTYHYTATPPMYPYGGSTGGAAGAAAAGKAAYGGAGAGSGGAAPVAPQQPYDAAQQPQDSYKQGGYSSSGSNVKAATSAAAADLTNAMYAKAHVALNKVNSYEKAAFQSLQTGGGAAFGAGGPQHLYIPAGPPPHHAPPPQPHQMDVRVNSNHRRDNGAGSGGRGGAGQSKQAAKQGYNQSYWTPN